MKSLKYLWVYSAHNQWTVEWNNKLIESRRERGYDVVGFCCTPSYLNERRWLSFPQLDKMWKIGYPPLIRMYKELLQALQGRNVLIHYNGANLHPEFVKRLNIYKVYNAADDPESTEILTKPVAKYYDLHLINNIACIDMYKSWGLKNVYFWPLGSLHFQHEVNLSKEDVIDISKRTVPIIYVGEYNVHKKDTFDKILEGFPNAECRGSMWPKGYISQEDMYNTYKLSQIGFNIHNSTGPINFRTYELPAFGIMQICDNKKYLGDIFTLDEEVIGFETVTECMDKMDKYLSNTNKQRKIALAGWERWQKEYTPIGVWEKLVFYVEKHFKDLTVGNYSEALNVVEQQERKYSKWKEWLYKIK